MSDKLKVQLTLTSPLRISWPEVMAPKANPNFPAGKAVYSARFVFPPAHPDLKTFLTQGLLLLRKMHAMSEEASESLGKLQMTGEFLEGQLRAHKDFWWPFTTGDALIAKSKAASAAKNRKYGGWEDYMAGAITLYAKAYPDNPPQLDVPANGDFTAVTVENRALHKSKFFNGMDAVGAVTLAGAKTAQGWGVTCYLNGLAAMGTGEHVGGRPEIKYGVRPSMTGSISSENPLAGNILDDEIPF